MSNLFDELPVPESAGLISFNRVSGRRVLFGSPFDHQGYITMRVHKAEKQRSTGCTWYMADRQASYIEVSMSYSQFAEAITAMNIGDGVPCTVDYFDGEKLEEPWIEDDRAQFEKEIDEDTLIAVESIQELVTAIKEEKMSKKAQERLINLCRKSIKVLTDKLPFIANMYAKHLDKLEQLAKTEISAYGDMVVRQYGLDAIQAGLPQLPEGY